MTEIARKKQLVILRHPPYGSGLARAAVDLSLAMGAFEQEFDLLFLGEGVLQLLDDQASEAIGLKSVGKALSSLPLYDVEAVYVDARALRLYGLQAADLVVPAKPLDDPTLQALLSACDHLLSC